MSLDQSKIIETIVQHDEIHLEDYLIEKAHNLSLWKESNRMKKIEHPIYVTV